jgi:hypothetical protein
MVKVSSSHGESVFFPTAMKSDRTADLSTRYSLPPRYWFQEEWKKRKIGKKKKNEERRTGLNLKG